MYNVAQSFYIDPLSVANSSLVYLTSIDLFFKSKPSISGNPSGILGPGVNLFLANMANNIPDTNSLVNESNTRVEYLDVITSNNSANLTSFAFSSPIPVSTGKYYAILLKYDDPSFVLWDSVTGDRLVGTNNPSPGPSGKYTGDYFDFGNSGTISAKSDTDLKFRVNAALFTSNNASYELVNKNYEFFTLDTISGIFRGGERVFEDGLSPFIGTISVTANTFDLSGNSTLFTSNLQSNDYIVISSGNTYVVRQINTITSNTVANTYEAIPFSNTIATYYRSPVAQNYIFDSLSNTIILSQSNANTSVKFTAGTKIRGETSNASANVSSIDNFPVHNIIPEIYLGTSANSTATLSIDFANSTYNVDSNRAQEFTNEVNLDINSYNGMLMSRSNEVSNPNNLWSNNKSSVIEIDLVTHLPTTAMWEAPFIYVKQSDVLFFQNQINNDDTNENTVYGNAEAKHITTKIDFANGMVAEDIVVYVDAYQPSGTTVEAYAKIFNNQDTDAFDDKDWTPLDLKDGINLYSSLSNPDDIIELTFGFPQFPPSNTTITGTVSTSDGSSTITGTGTDFSTDLAANTLVKIYQPLFPANYMIASISSIANGTSLTINEVVSNDNVIGDGLNIDTLVYDHTAFNNILNANVARYYNSSMNLFDGYNTFALKIDMLSSNSTIVPRIKQLRAIGVSS